MTGRVLSIRDHAIHALLPESIGIDSLTAEEALFAPAFRKHGIGLFKYMITLRKLAGQILESIYIARSANGLTYKTSFQQICDRAEEIHNALLAWDQELAVSDVKPSREYSEMRVESCLLQLLLHRPSPTFMIPSPQMVQICSKAVSSAVECWSNMEREFGIAIVCYSSRVVHSILLVGLAALYCDW